MKGCFTGVLFFALNLSLFSQAGRDARAGNAFWKETFSSGVVPAGWILHAANDSNISWEVTNQPFPGSYGRDQQAPPIASGSGGFHMQFSPGVKVDRRYKRWEKAGIWPDAYFQTKAIDCSGKKSVVLRFHQNFMWNDWGKLSKDAGLFVGVSSNGNEWKEYEVRMGIASEGDCPNPMNVELNITHTAAMQKEVFLRFYWRGIFAWYWMLDDISLSEALENDLAAESLVSHQVDNNTFTDADVFRYKVVNAGAKPIGKPFECYLLIDKRDPLKVIVPFSEKSPFAIIDTAIVSFPPVDLTDYGIHRVKFYTSLPEDNRNTNDTISQQLFSHAYELGPVSKYSRNGNTILLECNHAKFEIDFFRPDLFRIQMAYDGIFTNPAGNDIVLNNPEEKVNLATSDQGTYYLIQTDELALRAYKAPLHFALYKADNARIIWEECRGLTYGKETVQHLKRGTDEYFYGGGMQNGRFSHRDKTILMRIDWNWEDGGAPNPAPFYMSTNGYGALRNTYAPGMYAFSDTMTFQHSEARFDCYYFTGNSLKDILSDYTDLTGKPFLPPRWALGMGDANCYNRGAKQGKNTTGYAGTTPDVIPLIADKYIENNIPRGWILPNDGYGCGYTKLDSVIHELSKKGFHTGLWTESGVEKIAREVGEYGSRLCKLDVAWVGEGYKFAIDGCKAAYSGIERNSDARGFVWSVCGWAGTHRNSVVWTGDQSGSWNYIRWHIPTLIGSGLSAQNCATGDIDGIFGGSAKTFTRDLQWKCFTPVFMSMSGWAPKDKQPYVYGEPYTSINRKYLQLKLRLTPYMYTLCAEAWKTGVPAVRALVLEYPDDPVVKGTATQYEFLLGKSILVAPVYRDVEIRDSIYFPFGKWYDYWDGSVIQGGRTMHAYPAPLDRLPLFVREGSIIPMYPPMNYDNERPADTLTLDIYPGENSFFEMFEDDGSSRAYRDGAYSITRLEAKCIPTGEVGEIVVAPAKGLFKGILDNRAYRVIIHSANPPDQISVQSQKIRKYKDLGSFRLAGSGWFFDPNEKGGIVHVKTRTYETSREVKIRLSY